MGRRDGGRGSEGNCLLPFVHVLFISVRYSTGTEIETVVPQWHDVDMTVRLFFFFAENHVLVAAGRNR